MQSRLLLNIVVRQGTTILQLLASKDKPLLIWRNSLLVLNLGLNIVDGVGRLNLQRDRLSGKRLHKNLHAATETEDEVKGGFFLDVVIREGTTVLKLFAGEDEALLVRGDSLLVLDLGLNVVDRVGRFDLQRDRLARQGLDEDLHSATETEDEVEGGFLLNVIVREGSPVFELLPGEDEALLIRRNTGQQ